MAEMRDGCFLHSGTFSTFPGTFIASFLLILPSNDRSLINTSNFILAPIPGPFRPPGGLPCSPAGMSGSGRVVIGPLKAEKSFQLLIKDEGDKIKIRRLWIALLYFSQFLLFSP